MSVLLDYIETVGLPERPVETVRWLRDAPVTSGEWLALVKRQAKEMTLREVACSLDVGLSRIHMLCKAGVLEKTRCGFISTRSVYEHVAREQAKIDSAKKVLVLLEVEQASRLNRKRRAAARQGIPSPPGSTLVARGALSGKRVPTGCVNREVLSQRLQQQIIKSCSDTP